MVRLTMVRLTMVRLTMVRLTMVRLTMDHRRPVRLSRVGLVCPEERMLR
jgi:hypothetical protein